MLLNGWITPEGEIKTCEKFGHEELARELIRSIDADAEDISNFYDFLFDHGYVRFFTLDISDTLPKEQLFFEYHLTDIPVKIMFAQGRLLKQIK